MREGAAVAEGNELGEGVRAVRASDQRGVPDLLVEATAWTAGPNGGRGGEHCCRAAWRSDLWKVEGGLGIRGWSAEVSGVIFRAFSVPDHRR